MKKKVLTLISMTEKAVKAAKDLAEAEGISHTSIRLRVIGGGCAGFSYDMFFSESVNEMDETFEFDGVKIIVDPLSLQYLDNIEVDFIDGPFGSGFKFNNPNVTGSCGCGSSFSV